VDRHDARLLAGGVLVSLNERERIEGDAYNLGYADGRRAERLSLLNYLNDKLREKFPFLTLPLNEITKVLLKELDRE